MAVFSSRRERNLWFVTLGAIAAIYVTLPFAGRLAGILSAHGLLEISFSLGVLLIGLIVLAHALKSRSDMPFLVIMLAVFAVYFLAFVRIANPAERTHLVEYGVVALLCLEALRERKRRGRVAPAPALLATMIASAVGALDEAIQFALPCRVFDVRDIGFNTLAAVMAVGSSTAISWARRRTPD